MAYEVKKLRVQKATNGYIIQAETEYSDKGDPEIVTDLGGVFERLSDIFVLAPEREKNKKLLENKKRGITSEEDELI